MISLPLLESSFQNILFCHWLGDYLFQTSYLAENKFLPDKFYLVCEKNRKKCNRGILKSWLAATIHAIAYTACYLPLTHDPVDLLVIGGSHLLIDHYRVAAWIARLKEWNWKDPQPVVPPFVMLILDQGLHLSINCWMLGT